MVLGVGVHFAANSSEFSEGVLETRRGHTRYFFRSMVETLTYITSQGISHRDIKLENMLVNDSFELKFTDFGFASFS